MRNCYKSCRQTSAPTYYIMRIRNKIGSITLASIIRPYQINSLFELIWPQNSGLVGRAGDNLSKNFNYKRYVFLCKLVVFQLSKGLYYVMA